MCIHALRIVPSLAAAFHRLKDILPSEQHNYSNTREFPSDLRPRFLEALKNDTMEGKDLFPNSETQVQNLAESKALIKDELLHLAVLLNPGLPTAYGEVLKETLAKPFKLNAEEWSHDKLVKRDVDLQVRWNRLPSSGHTETSVNVNASNSSNSQGKLEIADKLHELVGKSEFISNGLVRSCRLVSDVSIASDKYKVKIDSLRKSTNSAFKTFLTFSNSGSEGVGKSESFM